VITYREVYDSITVPKATDSLVCNYNEHGIQTAGELFTFDITSGEFLEKYVDHFDRRGKVKKEVKYDKTMKPDGEISYEYNLAGKLIKEMGRLADGTLDYTEIYSYGHNGLLVEEQQIDPDQPDLKDKWIYKYDDKGNKI
jgi:hypothetical protein